MSAQARRYPRSGTAIAGAIVLSALVAIAIFGRQLSSHDPLARDIDHGLTHIGMPLPPSAAMPLGTDQLGRDVWARVVAGTTASLEIAALSTLICLVIGLATGITAGYAGGWIDAALMRFVDLVLAFPVILVAILLAALLRETRLSSSIAPVVLTLGTVGWPPLARVVRAKTRVLAQSEFVVAAHALGATQWRIATAHVVPNLLGIVIATTVLLFAQNLLAESVLSFLGLGPPPPAATWGRMLFEGRAYYRTAPWLTLAPGIAILAAVMSVNLLSEGLRHYRDVRGRR